MMQISKDYSLGVSDGDLTYIFKKICSLYAINYSQLLKMSGKWSVKYLLQSLAGLCSGNKLIKENSEHF
jgi:hypothetical protein